MDDLRTFLSRFIWTDGIIQDELLFQLRSIPDHRDRLLDIIEEDIEYLAADDDIYKTFSTIFLLTSLS